MDGLIIFKEFINKLHNNTFIKHDVAGDNIKVSFLLNPSAELNDIIKVENELGVPLPNSYKNFLRLYNGAKIFDYEGLDGFIILGTNDLMEANKLVAETFEDDWVDYLIMFAKYIGEGNYLAFDVRNGEYNIVDCFTEELPKEWNQIDVNFDSFLENIIKNEGNKYWL
jgi:hypothetical protein